MFAYRERKNEAAKARQLRPLIDVAATHEFLPLQDELWLERFCTLRKDFIKVAEQIQHFEVRDDDVFVVTLMKCGTTWMQETAWLLMHQLDFRRAKALSIQQRSIYLEFIGLYAEMSENSIEMCNQQQSPRVIKSHLPMNLLPKQLWQKKSKIIFVARNVKDVVVSTYHFAKGVGQWNGNINEFVQDFMDNEIMYLPYWADIVDFWKLRHEPHIFFVTFEEMKRDLSRVINRLCVFLERPQLTELELKDTLEHLSFDKMKKNKSTNITDNINSAKIELKMKLDNNFEFMRRGIVGSYKDELSAENQRILSEWSRKYLAQHGITEEDIFGNL